ncbi:hypothetical protein [Lactiplantibacillus mudanjiangensis]|uniref:Uncharacterized protein n=1 Tax=Lactiplantibacillus mudanjiangensis TaxID=1296538 RepID=A0A660DWL8_9LACO|nr:hypothetical protein [Lactiplantibacillus mudanjiangensis]VDG18986.1 hypothetical protein [Lactobacillus sp. CBA3605] [Lactiplantibacillus mudanjiangensis]VDG25240.1 hypothetical protein [Lactobacillus sp. CBA3605] [Lactiplantibacillus mudanjiangensis]VDG27506.1 hypothetical protein [Lactobacillus sp. CBA3605] [Lactiplantibacillus mudanjiangensis]VDG33083.1 hypothetical protein [Lactobacillus sp. CBA3605] [Lactiplantibacillus mudanjiangensis]
MTNYSALMGPDRYDLAVNLAQQYHLDPSQVLFGYLQVVSDITGGTAAEPADLHDPKVMDAINTQFDHFLKQRH